MLFQPRHPAVTPPPIQTMPTATAPKPRRPGLGRRVIAPVPLTKYKTLTSLAEFEAVCSQPIIVECVMHGKTAIRLEGKPLRPDQVKRLNLILNQAMPPELPPDPAVPDGEPRFDFRDLDYQTRKETNRRKARALALWWSFPLFSQAKAQVADTAPTEDEIMDFVESRQLDDTTLDLAFAMVTRDVVGIVDPKRVGFMSGSGERAS